LKSSPLFIHPLNYSLLKVAILSFSARITQNFYTTQKKSSPPLFFRQYRRNNPTGHRLGANLQIAANLRLQEVCEAEEIRRTAVISLIVRHTHHVVNNFRTAALRYEEETLRLTPKQKKITEKKSNSVSYARHFVRYRYEYDGN
jgi:predicted DNA-binding protein YlxM (UPF0122 family)